MLVQQQVVAAATGAAAFAACRAGASPFACGDIVAEAVRNVWRWNRFPADTEHFNIDKDEDAQDVPGAVEVDQLREIIQERVPNRGCNKDMWCKNTRWIFPRVC